MREYSIPHLRQTGRISIPEDSFDRIREARDLHKEGLGTETVRRQLREGSTPDSGELDRRLDTLYRTVEDLREDVSFSQQTPETAIQTNPTAGAPAKPGAPVTLILSAGPAKAASSAATFTATATATASSSAN